MTRTAFITGAAGFLGRHLVERLTAAEWSITAFDRAIGPMHVLPPSVTIEVGDLADLGRLAEAVPDRVDAVFHLAGNTSTWSRNRDAQFRDNVEGTAHVVEVALAAHAARFVYTSSISAYGYQPGVRLDENSPSNVASRGDNYGKSKYAAECLVKDASQRRGLSAIILNPVNILGAYDSSNWSRQLIMPIATGRLPVVPPGSATWVGVHDVVDAHLAAVEGGGSGSNVILGGVEASFRDVVSEIERLLDKPVSDRVTSKATMRTLFALSTVKAAVTRAEPELSLAKYRRSVGDLLVDDRLARTELGLRHTPLDEQLEQSIGWLREVGMLPVSTAGARP